MSDDPARHRDDGSTIYAFADPEVLVACPGWLTSAKNREQVLAVLDRLAQR